MSSTAELRLDWCSHEAAKYAVGHWHYSKSLPPPPMVHVGVWEAGRFIGCVLFSRGANNNMLKPYGLAQTQGCELVRVALTGHSVFVTRMIVAISISFLRKQAPSLRLIVSFADPEQGHVGAIYQAGNWIYVGQNEPSIEYIGPDGRRWHGRMVKKQGWTTVYGKRRRVLTPSECSPITRAGKHRYLFPLDSEMRAKIVPLALPYPKRVRSIETSAVQAETGGEAPTRTLHSPEDID